MNLRESLKLVGSGVVESHGLKEGGQDWFLCCHNSLRSRICLGSKKGRQLLKRFLSLGRYVTVPVPVLTSIQDENNRVR
jgi:hypothetical protein